MIFAGTGTVKFPTGDCEPLQIGSIRGNNTCDLSTGRNAPANATFKALHCGTGKSDEQNSGICERLGRYNVKPCASGELPYIKRINSEFGARQAEMGCMSRQQCTQVVPGLQPIGASDPRYQQPDPSDPDGKRTLNDLNDLCTGPTSDPKFVATLDYECTFCCVGDGCNSPVSGCYAQPNALWTVP
jgi:hypothetical protein